MNRETEIAVIGTALGVIIGIETVIILGQRFQIASLHKSRKKQFRRLKRQQQGIDVLLEAIPSSMFETVKTRLEFLDVMAENNIKL